MNQPRLIVGISGSSGIIYGIRLLQALKTLAIESHLVVSKAAQLTRSIETSISAPQLKALADVHHHINHLAAPIASGSYKTLGMIIAPCSMNTLGEIAHGITSSLLTRAADVVLKERRRLVLLPREAPLHLGHLRNMVSITEMGGIVFPPTPTLYNKPDSIEAMIDDTLGRVLDLFDLDNSLAKRWGE